MEIFTSRACVCARPESVSRGRLFVCGDIHGCYDELMQQLRLVGFDTGRDWLVALGDLVDRGPKSAEVLALLTEPWFTSIRGNHEELMIQAVIGDPTMHIITAGSGLLICLPTSEFVSPPWRWNFLSRLP